MTTHKFSRRDFIAASTASALFASAPVFAAGQKRRVALVGTGIRGTGFWGKYLNDNYSDVIDYVGLCDINPGRLEYALDYMGVDCPVFTDFDAMLAEARPDLVIVTTVDSTHDEFIVRGLDAGVDVITEKPMTTDETKCQAILDAAEESKGKLIVALNYRNGVIFSRLKEHLLNEKIGCLTSIDFHWYLNTYHGASYFRRWHGLRDKGGTLLCHKSAHHFDLLNWWIDSEPVEVHAYGGLEHYGHNNPFRGKRCMDCPHTDKCEFFWDMTKDERLMALYHANEKYDGYIRDNCLWREEIDIFDKMAVQIRYANDVQVSYSLTTYSPYEGFRVAFNGMKGRMETWEGVPSLDAIQQDQSQLHA
ncbi:MAG: Gfo/Idh/MocA family oxidoreductase, partial [Gammaproteobacteria bacterium]|nr:Gfo/Idh/MocA family oxidoreductase [Gammaproteobacteria bacterium]